MASVIPPSQSVAPSDLALFLKTSGIAARTLRRAVDGVVFRQGAAANSVFYVESGSVKLSVLSPTGREAVVAMLERGDFLGEGCLAGQRVRMGSAIAVTAASLLRIRSVDMQRMLQEQQDFSVRFISHMLARNIRIEADLVDQLFNSSEKRLARTLLLLARYGRQDAEQHVLPRLSQETLAEMIGTTRSRVNFFMNKFRKLGYIEYNGKLVVRGGLLSVVLHD